MPHSPPQAAILIVENLLALEAILESPTWNHHALLVEPPVIGNRVGYSQTLILRQFAG